MVILSSHNQISIIFCNSIKCNYNLLVIPSPFLWFHQEQIFSSNTLLNTCNWLKPSKSCTYMLSIQCLLGLGYLDWKFQNVPKTFKNNWSKWYQPWSNTRYLLLEQKITTSENVWQNYYDHTLKFNSSDLTWTW